LIGLPEWGDLTGLLVMLCRLLDDASNEESAWMALLLVSLLASIGVLQTPNVNVGIPARLRCTGLLGIDAIQTP
jgi:hypothetical protein